MLNEMLNADADLVRTCEQHRANILAFNQSDAVGAEKESLWAEYERTRDAIGAAKPIGMAGMVAKARIAVVEATAPSGEITPEGTMGELWAWDLLNDLLRLGSGLAVPAA